MKLLFLSVLLFLYLYFVKLPRVNSFLISPTTNFDNILTSFIKYFYRETAVQSTLFSIMSLCFPKFDFVIWGNLINLPIDSNFIMKSSIFRLIQKAIFYNFHLFARKTLFFEASFLHSIIHFAGKIYDWALKPYEIEQIK